MHRINQDTQIHLDQYGQKDFNYLIKQQKHSKDIYYEKSENYNTNISLECECGQSFNTTDSLKSHIMSTHYSQREHQIPKPKKRRRFKMPDIQKSRKQSKSTNETTLIADKRSYQLQNERVRCFCAQTFKNANELNLHQKQKHHQLVEDQLLNLKNYTHLQYQHEKDMIQLDVSKASKEYFSTRIFMCGSCEIIYLLHLVSTHDGAKPDGTIYGVRKDQLLKYFAIPFQKSVFLYNKHKHKVFCGCGKKYTNCSSLAFHVMYDHRGIPPQNTMGLPRRMRSCAMDKQFY